jgi:hypothetical protein
MVEGDGDGDVVVLNQDDEGETPGAGDVEAFVRMTVTD